MKFRSTHHPGALGFLTLLLLMVFWYATPLVRGTADTSHPIAQLSQPTTVAPQPTTVAPQPTTVAPQPTTVIPQPTTAVPQPTTVVPQPTTVSFFGMNTYFTGLERYWTDQEQDYHNPSITVLMELGRAAGVEWGREELSWDNLQYAPGVWDNHVRSRFYDKQLLAMAQSGYGIIGMLVTTEKNARVADCDERIARYTGNPEYVPQGPIWCPPANLQQFQDFVRSTVERYDGDGTEDAPGSPRIAVWQVWNEPNHWETWPGSAEEYGRFLEAAYHGVKAADPTALVMIGGLYVLDGQSAVLGNCACHKDGLVFFREVLDAYPAAWNAFDVLAIHPYMPFDAPDSPDLLAKVTLWGRITTTQQWLAAQTQRRGGTMRPIWISEVGWISDATTLTVADEQWLSRYRIPETYRRQADGGGKTYLRGVSESAQAVYLIRAHVLAQALAIPHLNYFQLEDKFDAYFGKPHPWAGAALLRPKIPGSVPAHYPPKPAYDAYRVLTEQLHALRFVGFGSLHTYSYPQAGYNPVARYHLQYLPSEEPHLQQVDILWQSRGSHEVLFPLHPLASGAEMVSYQGSRTPLVPQNGMVAVTVSEYPIYIRQTLSLTPPPTDTASPPETPTPPRTTIPTPSTPTPTATPLPDGYEPDNRCQDAPMVTPDGAIHVHTFHTADDTDWVRFEAVSGTTYLIEAVVPPHSVANVALALFSDCKQLRPVSSQSFAFTPDARMWHTAATTTSLFLMLSNTASAYGREASYHLAIHALPRARADTFVIVEGRGGSTNRSLQSAIARIGPSLYSHLLDQGYTKDWIYFLLPDIYDSPIMTRSLESAITTWAAHKTGPKQMLTIFMIGEVQDDHFLLNQAARQRVTLPMLNQWINALERQRPDIQVNVIIDTPGSAWSSNQAEILSKPGRVVIIASSSAGEWQMVNQHVRYVPSYDVIFSDYFLTTLKQQSNLFHALLFSQHRVSLSMPWYHFQLSGISDAVSQRRFLASGTTTTLLWPPRITAFPPRIVEPGSGYGIVQAVVQAAEPERATVEHVFATIYPPPRSNAREVSVGSSGTKVISRTHFPTVTLVLKDATKHLYEGQYDGFTDAGSYRVVIQARDSQQLFADPVIVVAEVPEPRVTSSTIYLPMVLR